MHRDRLSDQSHILVISASASTSQTEANRSPKFWSGDLKIWLGMISIHNLLDLKQSRDMCVTFRLPPDPIDVRETRIMRKSGSLFQVSVTGYVL